MHLARLVKEHWAAIVMSVAIGAVVIAPQIIFIQQMGPAYKGIYMLNTDAELHYLARMEEAVKGDGIGNPFVIDYRNKVPSGFYSYSEEVLSLPARVLPISIPTLNLVYKFLLPAILALLIYAFVFRLSRSVSWALVSMLAVVLGSTAFNVGSVLTLLHLDFVYYQFLLFSRPVNPIFSLIFFFIYMHVLLMAERTQKFAWYVALGALTGLAWYIFIFLATFMLALEASYVFLHALKRDISAALRHGAAVLVGLVVALPALVSINAIAHSPYYSLFVGPIGLAHTHLPYVHIPWLVVTALFLLFWYFHREYKHTVLLGGLLLASLAVVNQQVLTGVSLHPGHYLTYFCIPVYIVVLCAVAHGYFKDKHLTGVLTLQIVTCLYVLCAAGFIQYSSYIKWAPVAASEQQHSAVLSWLSSHTAPESVVMANPALSALIPAYTADNVMWEAHADSYLEPQSRWDFTPQNALAVKDFCSFIAQYRLDYVVRDSADADWSEIDTQKCVRLLVQINGFSIYAVQK